MHAVKRATDRIFKIKHYSVQLYDLLLNFSKLLRKNVDLLDFDFGVISNDRHF